MKATPTTNRRAWPAAPKTRPRRSPRPRRPWRAGDLGRSRRDDHRQRHPLGRLCGRRPAPLPRLWPGRPELRGRSQIRRSGHRQRRRRLLPGRLLPGCGAVSLDVEYEGDANNEPASLACGAENQASTVAKASPTLAGLASSAEVGETITDSATLSGGFGPAASSSSAPMARATRAARAQSNTKKRSPSAATAPTPRPAFPGCGAVSLDGRIRRRRQQRTGEPGLRRRKPGLDGRQGLADPRRAGEPRPKSASDHRQRDPLGRLSGRRPAPLPRLWPGRPELRGRSQIRRSGHRQRRWRLLPGRLSPGAGLYRWTVEYEGDANNEPASLACGAENQASAVGTVDVTLEVSATGGTVGSPVNATATIEEGAIPAGQLTFKAFFPGDATCSRTAAFSSTVGVAGNGPYRSAVFLPSRVGTFRWTVGYSGDVNHAPTTAGCGSATSSISQAAPSITGEVKKRLLVGTSIRDTATLRGGLCTRRHDHVSDLRPGRRRLRQAGARQHGRNRREQHGPIGSVGSPAPRSL